MSVPLRADIVSNPLIARLGVAGVPSAAAGNAPGKRRWTMEERRSEPDRAENEGVEPEESLGREPLGEGEEGWEELEETADEARS